jgi:hypothetical protein
MSGNAALIPLKAGQMIAISAEASPLKMDATVAGAFHPSLDEVPITQGSRPPLGVRFQNWLLKGGIGAAQIITLVTYFLALIALIGFPLSVVFWAIRRKRH